MPSGSRGGGGHSGGGRSGGGHSGGGWSGSGHGGSHRHYGYRGGHRVIFMHGSSGSYMRTSHNAILVFMRVLMFICFMLAIAHGTMWSNENDFKQSIERDYNRYQQMIAIAKTKEEQGFDYIIKANVTRIATEEDSCGKWYIEYFFNDSFDSPVEGYTFDTYTKERAMEIKEQGWIEIAVESLPIFSNTDSIDVEYANTTLTDDGQYLHTLNLIKKGKNVTIISGAVLLGLIIFSAILTNKFTVKEETDLATTNDETADQPSAETANTAGEFGSLSKPTAHTHIRRKCAYCNSRIKDGEVSCSKCGATIRD